MNAEAAREELPDELAAVPASAAPALHPAVASAVAARPDSFSTWVPADLCLYWSHSVEVNGRRITDDDAHAVGIWSILARPADSANAAPAEHAVKLWASNWRAARLARSAQIDFSRFNALADKVPVENEEGEWVPGPDDRYQVRIGKTTIIWDGRFAGDTAAAPAPNTREWRVDGLGRTHWTVRNEVHPEATHAVVGALRVSGKDDLAKALGASPIRFVGPWHTGGTAQIVFTR